MTTNSINLYFSHEVEQLAALLADNVMTQQAKGSIFNAPKVLVPNANMQRYLQLTVAKDKGICAHVDFPFLETGLFQTVNQLLGSKFHHLNGAMVAWSIWSLLLDEQLINEPVYAPIKTYLSDQGSARLQATKCWQLSQKLAKLMLDYESQRPEMIHQWLQGKCVFNASQNHHLLALEQMQQDLYVRLFTATDDQTAATLFQAAQWLGKSEPKTSQPAIHIFTPSRLSQLHRKLLVQLGEFMSVHIYSLNVCSEYWEDLQTETEIRWQQRVLNQYKQHPVAVVDTEGRPIASSYDVGMGTEEFAELGSFINENDLLKAWGKPGREALKLFSDIEEDAIHKSIAYHDDWLVPDLSATNSLLHVVQTNILNRSADQQQINDPNALNSLQLACAPSIIREVEAVYNSILWNLNQYPDLALNEIAVLVSDMNAYRFVIEQVFETLNHQHEIQLSYAIVDSSAAKESRYAEAVLDLFTVLEDDFIRASVFNWLDNPCVQAGNHFDATDWQDWLLVVDHLGIYCGYSSLYPSMPDDGNLEVSKLFTWQQGLARLHQSLATSPNDANAMDVSAIGAERIGQLSVLIETIYQYKLRLNQIQTASQWEQQLNQLFDLLLAVPADDQKEQNIQLALQQSLVHLADAQPELKLSFEDIKQFIAHEIQQLPASKGSYLSGGVVCAALQPMRPIPFKLTYILGLDEKTFPGQIRHETLDLTQRSRRIGDINTVENNNYLLLETLMCTREKLYVSYVGMDLLKDEVIEPSATFSTLYRYCESLIDFSAMEIDHLPIVQLPLDASESAHFGGNQLELHDWGINYAYADYLLMISRHKPNWQPHIDQLTTAQLRAWQKNQTFNLQQQEINTNITLTQGGAGNLQPIDSKVVIHIDANDLADYLANPQAAVLKQLGVNSKHPEDRSLLEHEPHAMPVLLKHEIFNDSIQQWLERPQTADLSAIIKQQHQKHLVQSQAPMALFAGLAELSYVANDLDEKLKAELTDKQAIGTLRIGQARIQVAPDKTVDGLKLMLDSGQQVQINGLTQHLYHQNGYLTDQVVISSSKQNDEWNKKLLKPFINWCLWQLIDQVQVAEVFKVHLVFPEKVQVIEFKPWCAVGESFATKSTIEAYLKQLVTGMLEKPAQFLPSELLNKLNLKVDPKSAKAIPIKNHHFSTTCSYLAYEQGELTDVNRQELKQIYLSDMQWPSYEEILTVVDVQPSHDPLIAYRHNLLPLFAMVFGQFETQGEGGQS